MKKVLLISMMMVSAVVFCQVKPTLEKLDGDGTATYYYETGKVKQSGDFVDGQLEGEWIFYSEEGNVQVIGHYRNGKKHGKWQYFDSSSVSREVVYRNNAIVKEIIKDKNQLAYNK